MSVSSITSGGSSPEDNSYLRAARAERDAQDRILAAERSIKEAEREASAQLERLHDHYEASSMTESARQEAAAEAQRTKGYEKLREVQNSTQTQLRKAKRDGELDIDHTEEHFRHQTFLADRHGHDHLEEMLRQNQHAFDYEKSRGTEQIENIKAKNIYYLQHAKEETEAQAKSVQAASQTEIERLRTQSNEAKEQIRQKYDDAFDQELNHKKKSIDEIQENTNKTLKEMRRDTSEKLAAYGQRQQDPFYKMISINADFKETDGSFILSATVPEYEQEHISATVKGDNLVLSGYRRSEEKIDDEKGHSIATSSYQSFHESYPLSWPVDGRRISREYKDGILTIRVPKKNEFAFREPSLKKAAKDRVPDPNFPPNLVKAKKEKN